MHPINICSTNHLEGLSPIDCKLHTGRDNLCNPFGDQHRALRRVGAPYIGEKEQKMTEFMDPMHGSLPGYVRTANVRRRSSQRRLKWKGLFGVALVEVQVEGQVGGGLA